MLPQSDKRGTKFDLKPLQSQSPSTEGHSLPLQPPQKDEKILSGPQRQRGLSQIANPGDHPGQALVIRNESPWDTYKKEFDCDLAGNVAVVIHHTWPSKVFALRSFPREAADKMLQRFSQLQHENIISASGA